jgi:hypothetical protein
MAFGKHPSTILWTERRVREVEMINKMTFTILTRLKKLKRNRGPQRQARGIIENKEGEEENRETNLESEREHMITVIVETQTT